MYSFGHMLWHTAIDQYVTANVELGSGHTVLRYSRQIYIKYFCLYPNICCGRGWHP